MATSDCKTGVLLINLGTPDAPTPAALRRYLREFLMDARVIDLPWPARWLLVHGAILPRRPRTSAAAYSAIWTDAGSPLLANTRALAERCKPALGPDFQVEIGMRYGRPSIADGLARLREAGARPFVLLPLFPHNAEATTGSGLASAQDAMSDAERASARLVAPFYAHPAFVAAWRSTSLEALRAFSPDHVLLSYHGLPERQIRRADVSGAHCLASESCCSVLSATNADCYRAQCYATTRSLAAALELSDGDHSTAFQSRLGRTPWIRPYTDEVLPQLAERGVRRLTVVCPSFVADCLETLEEIGIRARDQWHELGGEALQLLACPNDAPAMATAVAALVREAPPLASAAGGRAAVDQPAASAAAADTPLAKASPTDTPSV